MSNEFEPGDLVRCVEAPGRLVASYAGTPGSLHVVTRISVYGGLDFEECVGNNADRFELVAKGPGWKLWAGGDNPAPGAMVKTHPRDGGRTDLRTVSEHWRWWHTGRGHDILAYRVTEPAEAEDPARHRLTPGGDRTPPAPAYQAGDRVAHRGDHELGTVTADDSGILVSFDSGIVVNYGHSTGAITPAPLAIGGHARHVGNGNAGEIVCTLRDEVVLDHGEEVGLLVYAADRLRACVNPAAAPEPLKAGDKVVPDPDSSDAGWGRVTAIDGDVATVIIPVHALKAVA
jgi:hypothetical protein